MGHDWAAHVGGSLRLRRSVEVGLNPKRLALIQGAASVIAMMKASKRAAATVILSARSFPRTAPQ
jgi:hypothetical protein